MERRDKASDVVLVASEPLTFERHNWLAVPTNTILTISDQTVFVQPIKDEFYVADPSVERSTGFAKDKGLISKAPGGAAFTENSMVPTPAKTPEPLGTSAWIEKPTLEELSKKMDSLDVRGGRIALPGVGASLDSANIQPALRA